MIYNSLEEIPYQKEYAVIVNVGTRLVTTLALMSAIRRSGMPVVLLDCKYKDIDDFSFFERLQKEYEFNLVSLPLKYHGRTLDDVFKKLKADYIMLVDSDLEILSDKLVPEVKKCIGLPDVFGAGFYQSSIWMRSKVNWEEDHDGYYEERIWIPFTMLNVSKVREALSAGKSFEGTNFYNVLPKYQNLSRRMIYSPKLHSITCFAKTEFELFNVFKKKFHGRKPLIVMRDTGSDIFCYLKYEKEYWFVGPDSNSNVQNEYVKHYSGITRRLLFDDPYNTGSLDKDYVEILARLNDVYGFDYEQWNKK